MLSRLELFLFAPGGGWAYTYVQRPDHIALIVALVTAAGLVGLWLSTESRFSSRRVSVGAVWILVALLCQAWYLSIAPFGADEKVTSVAANGFYTVSLNYTWADYLSRFHELRDEMPGHVRTNLPGKVLLFFALRSVSENILVLAGLIVLLSTAGAAVVYVVARQWFDDRRVAMQAMILYLLYPARIFFLPLMNSVAPLLMLLPIACAGRCLETQRLRWAVGCGVALSALLLFDPLPLFGGLCGLALCIELARRRSVAPRRVAIAALVAVAPVALTYVLLLQVFHLDLVAAYRFSMTVAREFNVVEERPYYFWLAHNLKDFFVALGAATSLVIFVKARHWLTGTGAMPAVAAVATLLLLDVSGLNRGEVQRLWIFLGALWLPLAAKVTAYDRRLAVTVLACAAMQIAVCIRSIGWVIP